MVPCLAVLAALLAAPQDPPESETGAALKAALDRHFPLMPEAWRAERRDRWRALIDGPRVAPETRRAILADLDRAARFACAWPDSVQRLATLHPEAVPRPERLRAGLEEAAGLLENLLGNAVLYPPLDPAGRAERERHLEALRREALGAVDGCLVGDRRAREIAAGEVQALFDIYRGEIGRPLRPFLNLLPDPAVVEEALREMREELQGAGKIVLDGLTGDPDRDRERLRELGVSNLVYRAVVLKLYLPLSNASWADRERFEAVKRAECSLEEWTSAVKAEAGLAASATDTADPFEPRTPEGRRAPRPEAPAPVPAGPSPPAAAKPRPPGNGRWVGIGILAAVALLLLRLGTRSRSPGKA